MTHDELSYSSAHRWMRCPGSVRATRNIPRESSSYANDGSACHKIASTVLESMNENQSLITIRDKIEFTTFLLNNYKDKYIEEFNVIITSEMLDNVHTYIKYLINLGGNQLYETSCKMNYGGKDRKGTCDAIVFNQHVIHIIDLKMGYNRVHAKGNEQLMMYALATHEQFKTPNAKYFLTIVQPRLDSIDTVPIDVEELLEFKDRLETSAKIALHPNSPIIPHPKACKYCAIRATCKELSEEVDEIVSDLSPVSTLSDADIKRVLDNRKLIKEFLTNVEEHICKRLEKGEEFDGYTLSPGRCSYKITNTYEFLSRCDHDESNYKEPELLPISSLRKKYKNFDERFGDLVKKTPGKLCLSKVSATSRDSLFDDFEEGLNV